MNVPKQFKGDTKKEWERITSELTQAGLMSDALRPLLTLYCEVYHRHNEANEHVAKDGAVVEAPKTGTPMYSAWYTIASRTHDQLVQILKELGLTPGRLKKLTKPAPESTDDFPDLQLVG